MHRALGIATILHEVFVYLGTENDDIPDSFIDASTLGSAASCCQAFSHPALDVLWRVMGSIDPLLSILPSLQRDTKPFTINGMITPAHWDRFQQYARRIRVLHCKESKVSPFAFIRISRLLKGEPLLPCLGHLYHHFESWSTLLITPTLYRVALDTSETVEDRDSLGAFLDGLTTDSPKLRLLRLTAEFSPGHIQIISQLMYLHLLSLTFRSPDEHALREISSLQHLTCLKLDVVSSGANPRIPPGTTGLRCLRRLQIRAHMSLVGDIIDLISSSSLEVLDIKLRPNMNKEIETDEQWRDLLNRITKWSHSLHKLHLHDNLRDMYRRNFLRNPSLTLLDELLMFPNVKDLTLGFKFSNLEILDDDIRRMATVWPKMHGFLFLGKSPTLLSINALEAIALYWPSIRKLALPLSLCSLPQPRYVKSHALKTLTVGAIPFEDPLLVARTLDSLFPSLELNFPRYSDVDQWEQVGDTLKAFRDIKRNHDVRLRNSK